MKPLIYILATALFSCSFAHSKEDYPAVIPLEPLSHRFSIGPDIFFQQAKKTHLSKGRLCERNSFIAFGGLRASYEYIKPNALYWGTSALAAVGDISEDETPSYVVKNGFFKKHTGVPTAGNAEQRIGYTIQSPLLPRSCVIPFIGAGWYYTGANLNYVYTSASWYYGIGGLRANQQFSDCFDIGFDLAINRSFEGTMKRIEKHSLDHFWGYKVGIPMTWRSAGSRDLEVEFQPYLLKFNANGLNQILGLRLQVGCLF